MKQLEYILNRFSASQLLWFAILVRIIAVVFSKGFAFSDDHFETVMLADEYLLHGTAQWAKGEIYLFNLLYPYTHVLIMGAMEWLGVYDPQWQMYGLRAFHALANIIMIVGAGRLAQVHYGENGRKLTYLFLGLFWMFPFMGVRSLREMFCMPFVFWALYYLEKKESGWKETVFAGVLLALAFVVRIQIVFVPIGFGVYMLIKKEWSKFGWLVLSGTVGLALTQGVFDALYWGNPLGSISAYVKYNLHHSGFYPNGPWYMYLLTVLGFCLPPFSLFILWGYAKTTSKYPYVFWGALSFFVFHSCFPNKQERFILPFFLLFFWLGVLELWNRKESLSLTARKWLNVSTYIFMVANTLMLIAITLTYSKKSRVEAMYHFYGKEIGSVVMCTRTELPMQPTYYSRQEKSKFKVIDLNLDNDSLKHVLSSLSPQVTHFLFTGNIGLEETMERFNALGFKCELEKSYPPSFVDNIAYLLNPKHNTNEVWTVGTLSAQP